MTKTNILKYNKVSHLFFLLSNLANLLLDSLPYIFPEDWITVVEDKIEEYPVRIFCPTASSTVPPLQ